MHISAFGTVNTTVFKVDGNKFYFIIYTKHVILEPLSVLNFIINWVEFTFDKTILFKANIGSVLVKLGNRHIWGRAGIFRKIWRRLGYVLIFFGKDGSKLGNRQEGNWEKFEGLKRYGEENIGTER